MADAGVDVERQAAGHGGADDIDSPSEDQPLNEVKVATSTQGSPTAATPALAKVKVAKEDEKKQCTCFPCCSCSRAVAMAAVGVMFVVWALALALGLGLGLRADDHDPQSSPSKGKDARRAVGAVAADHTACSEVGRDVLADGGSAVDAAIASLVCVGVRQPHSMGIGGGVFLAVYQKDPARVEMFDGREVAPAAATYTRYLNESFLFGPLSVGVPGEVRAYWEAHRKYGRLPWADLFRPAIKMAADGHPLSYSTARALRVLKAAFNVSVRDYPELCKLFCNARGEPKEEGDVVRMPALARTLQGIADMGPDYLYSASSAAAVNLSRDMQEMGVLVTLDDLEQYKVVSATPLSTSLGEFTLHTLTAPSGGPVMSLVLKILEGLNLNPSDLTDATSTAAMWHKIVETFKFAYADRLKLGDPAFVDISQLLEKMTSPAYADFLRDAIDPNSTYGTDHYTNIAGGPWREEGTTHISVVGPDGDAVSATSTINYYFGSLLVSPSTGVILNNEMADFADPQGPILDELKPASPNFIKPGKRPLSSMAPAIIVDKGGNPRLVLGSAGGARITTVNAQVTARVLWLQQSLEEAINAKRLHHQLFPNEIKWEPDFPQDVLKELQRYGHDLKPRTSYMAVVQAVARDPRTGEVTAFSDPRKHAEARLLYSSDIKDNKNNNNNNNNNN